MKKETNYPICNKCGYDVRELDEYTINYGLETMHKECAIEYYIEKQQNDECFCGGIIEDGICMSCGKIADESSIINHVEMGS